MIRHSPRRRRIRRASYLVLAITAAALGLTLALDGFGSSAGKPVLGSSSISRKLARPVPADHPQITFSEQARALGVDMLHGPGKRKSLLPEDMGPGLALEDLDGDGDLDLFFVNLCGPVGPGSSKNASAPASKVTHRLFRNDGGHFTDVTKGSGIDVSDLGIAVAAGDVDGDGLIDLYITCYGKNRLLRNLGHLKFEDITKKAGVGDDGFGAGAAFADADGDGDLDLYVCNYVAFQWDGKQPTLSAWGDYSLPYTVNPSSFPPAENRYYINNGDGTFQEAARKLGIQDAHGRSLQVTFADFSGDGHPDIYVCNDISENAYFESNGQGGFLDRSHDSLSADYRGAMGSAVADLDGDGDLDLFITHWTAQENALYVNLSIDAQLKRRKSGKCEFVDEADAFGLGQVSIDYVGWGTAFFDYDLDGILDLAVVNGSTMEAEDDPAKLVRERPLLFWHKPGKGFFEVGAVAGKSWGQLWNARGLADGDLDGDGDLDLVVASNRGPVRILINSGTSNHWLKVRLREPGHNRFAVGAQVRVLAGGRQCLQEVGAGNSYLCHRPLELTFGLGETPRAARVEIRWPDGTRTTLKDVAGNRVLVVRKQEHGK